MYFHIQACTEAGIDGEVTQCSWQTLWLHNEYRVYTSHATVYTELLWPLISSLSFFFLFHLGCNIFHLDPVQHTEAEDLLLNFCVLY